MQIHGARSSHPPFTLFGGAKDTADAAMLKYEIGRPLSVLRQKWATTAETYTLALCHCGRLDQLVDRPTHFDNVSKFRRRH
jgi:hypothetical protein